MKRFDPMLAQKLEQKLSTINEGEWYAEVKYDGTRIVSYVEDNQVELLTRRGTERSSKLPEVVSELSQLPNGVVLDGELAFFDGQGISHFLPLHTDRSEIENKGLHVEYIIFDILYDGEDLTETELSERKQRLHDVVPKDLEHVRIAPYQTTQIHQLYQETLDRGQEGIMLKKKNSWYYPDSRSSVWKKVKSFSEMDLIAVGYTRGEGSRQSTFGSLVLSDGEKYVGKVGTGFRQADLERLLGEMNEVDRTPKYRGEAGEYYQPVEPFPVAVKYQEISPDKKLRSPVFLQVENKPLEEIQPL